MGGIGGKAFVMLALKLVELMNALGAVEATAVGVGSITGGLWEVGGEEGGGVSRVAHSSAVT